MQTILQWNMSVLPPRGTFDFQCPCLVVYFVIAFYEETNMKMLFKIFWCSTYNFIPTNKKYIMVILVTVIMVMHSWVMLKCDIITSFIIFQCIDSVIKSYKCSKQRCTEFSPNVLINVLAKIQRKKTNASDR